jgi:hypothetical protein
LIALNVASKTSWNEILICGFFSQIWSSSSSTRNAINMTRKTLRRTQMSRSSLWPQPRKEGNWTSNDSHRRPNGELNMSPRPASLNYCLYDSSMNSFRLILRNCSSSKAEHLFGVLRQELHCDNRFLGVCVRRLVNPAMDTIQLNSLTSPHLMTEEAQIGRVGIAALPCYWPWISISRRGTVTSQDQQRRCQRNTDCAE